MDTRLAPDARAIGTMLMLCLVWGLQQVVLKATVQDIAPMLQISLRSGGAAVLVALVMLVRGEPWTRGTARAGLAVGALFALEFVLVAEGLRHTSASHMVVFLYTAPIFAAMGLQWQLPSERMLPIQWLGIALAFGGLAVVFLGRTGSTPGDTTQADMLWGDFLGLLAGAAWGATTVLVRCTRLTSAPPTQTLLYQLVAAFVVLLAVAWFSDQVYWVPSARLWASLAFHTVVVSFASFLGWFWLLRRYLATRLGVFAFMTPLFGMLLGAWLLNEPLEARFLWPALGVLAGVVLVSAGGAFGAASVKRP